MARDARLTASVRFRITVVAALAVAGVLVVTGGALVLNQRRVLTEDLDDTLAEWASDLAAGAEAGDLPPTFDPVGDDDAVAQVVEADGGVVAATPGDADRLPLVPVAPPGDDGGGARTVDLAVDDEGPEPYRVVARPAGTATVLVASPLDDVAESTGLLTRSLAVAVPAATLLLAALVWVLVGRTLRPVEAIRREVAGIGAGGLDRRVPVPPTGDEVARLARTMNAMLDRIEDGARRQERFVADASHELRSPLARVRAQVEVDAAHPDGADPAATRQRVLEETVGMQHLVDDLLVLARSDAAAGPRRTVAVDLDDVVARHVRRLRADGRVVVDSRGVGPAQVVGDPDDLGRAVGNVVDNAVRHARSTVTVAVAAGPGTAVVTVADDGPGIPADRREAVFERFTRLDGVRSPGGGTGLGLAIAREVVESYGGTIAVDPDHEPGSRFVITLPREAD
jgi:signal transduction histidine kinase